MYRNWIISANEICVNDSKMNEAWGKVNEENVLNYLLYWTGCACRFKKWAPLINEDELGSKATLQMLEHIEKEIRINIWFVCGDH